MADRAIDGIAELIHAGAVVAVVNGLHSKLIARDKDVFAQGEFNWLSALQIRNGQCSLKESTQIFTGEVVATRIIQEMERIAGVGYGFAKIQESNDGIEVTKAGKIFGLVSILIIPALVGNDLGNTYIGIACTAGILITCALYYGVKAVQGRYQASV